MRGLSRLWSAMGTTGRFGLGAGVVSGVAGLGATAWGALTGKLGTPQDILTNLQSLAKTAGVESAIEAFFHGLYKAVEKIGELVNRIPGFEGLGDGMIRWGQDGMNSDASSTLTTPDGPANGGGPDAGPGATTQASLMGGPDGPGMGDLVVPAGLGIAGLALARNADAIATSRIVPGGLRGPQADLFDGSGHAPRGKFGRLLTVAGYGTALTGMGVAGLNMMTGDAHAGELPVGSADLTGTGLEALTRSEINLGDSFADEAAAPPAEESFLDAAAHKGHVFAHGVQDGLVGLTGSPEDLWDMVDGWTGDWLPGDATTNSTYNFMSEVADDHLIGTPEIRDEWDAAIHAGGNLVSWAVPVGGALRVAGAGARTVNVARAFETTENIVGGQQLGEVAVEAAAHLIPR